MENFNSAEFWDSVVGGIQFYGIAIIKALLLYFVGTFVINRILKILTSLLEKKNVDPALRGFVNSITSVGLKIILLITVVGLLGIGTSSFIAVLGAAGLAVGLALQGTLQNFAGGVLILILKPFKLGDVIEGGGVLGSVAEIQIFNTIIKTPDNKRIIVPNTVLATGTVINYSAEPTRRVDWTFGVGYGDDADKAQKVITDILATEDKILSNPPVFVELGALADSSVNFTTRAWVKSEDYWNVFFSVNKKVYQTFEKEGLNIPFPQMDVHVQK